MAEDLQYILFGKEERIYREFRDVNNALIDPTDPFLTIYGPEGVEVDSGTPTKESTGVYYFSVSLSTASDTKEGIYQVFWEGTIDGALVSMDIPQYFYGVRVPWQITQPDSIISSIRRTIGDTDPNNYRISTQDMYYYFSDAVDEVQAEYNFGYTLTVTPTSMTWNKTLYSVPFVLFKMKTMIIILESTLNDCLFESGNVQVGDIKVDLTQILKMRSENLKRVKEDYKNMMYQIKMNLIEGFNIDTHKTGLINNTSYSEYMVYLYD